MILMLFISCTATEDTDSRRMSSALEKEQQKNLSKRVLRSLPFLTHAATVGCLTAYKKKPGGPSHGLIKVNCLNKI